MLESIRCVFHWEQLTFLKLKEEAAQWGIPGLEESCSQDELIEKFTVHFWGVSNGLSSGSRRG